MATCRIGHRQHDEDDSSSVSERVNTRIASVMVAVRIRPRLAAEQSELDAVKVLPDRQTLVLNSERCSKQFTVDKVFDSRQPESDAQDIVFSCLGQALVADSLCGYNVCLFAYGHTGSGKTYTMMGEAGNYSNAAGLLPRVLEAFFAESRHASCSCEYFEIYNEAVRDLLRPNGEDRSCKIHVHPKHGAHIDGLTNHAIGSVQEAMEILSLGNRVRAVAATTMNQHSSRSHAFFRFRYEQLAEATTYPSRRSAVTLVDLAGREDGKRLATQPHGVRYREMCCINTSLFHLTHVISNISSGTSEQSSLVDFRNSKLTLLLSQSLAGNCRTGVVATLSPTASAFEDSLSTMRFADSLKKLKTKPVVNSASPVGTVTELEAEVCRLKDALLNSTRANVDKDRELCTAQSMMTYYKRSLELVVAASSHSLDAKQCHRMPTLLQQRKTPLTKDVQMPRSTQELQCKQMETEVDHPSTPRKLHDMSQPEFEPSPTAVKSGNSIISARTNSETQPVNDAFSNRWNWDTLAPDFDEMRFQDLVHKSF